MKFTTYSISVLLALGISGTGAEAFIGVNKTLSGSVSPLAIAISTTTKKSVKMRSVSYLSKKLSSKGYVVRDARRKGQLYIFRSSKNGYTQLITVDARNGKIVGLKILTSPAGKTPRKAKSIGNLFIDESYEFGYYVSETEYYSYYEFTSEEYSSTEVYSSYTMETSEFVSYESISTESTDTTVTTETSDLDQGDVGDDEGNAEANVAAEDMPDAEVAPAEDTVETPPAEEAPPEKICPPEGDGTVECPYPEAPVEEAPPQEEPQAEEPQQEEAPAEEPQQEEAPAEEPPPEE